MISRANRIVIVGPHYSGPLMDVSDGIRKLTPCTVAAPTNRIIYSNVERSSISAKDLDTLNRLHLFFPAGEVIRLHPSLGEEMIGQLKVSSRTRSVLRRAISIPLTSQGNHKTGQALGTDLVGIEPLPATELATSRGPKCHFTLASVIDFAGKFWELFRQGVFKEVKRVDGHTDFGGFVLYLKPADIAIRTLFFPDGPDSIYPIASDAEAKALGGYDPLTGPKHYEGMSGAKAGMLAGDRTVFWCAWNFERFPESRRFGGFFNTVQAAGKISMLGDTIIPRENDPWVAAFNAGSMGELERYCDQMLPKVWDPTSPMEMPPQTACKYVSL